MKKKSRHKNLPDHSFRGSDLHLTWPDRGDGQEAPTLTIPLGAWLDESPIAFRKWAVRQKGAQARSQRGRGFVAVDYRNPAFHWRGKVAEPETSDLQYLRDVDLTGWELRHPGLNGERVTIDADANWSQRIGICDDAGAGYPEPRYWLLRHRSSGVGFMLSCAGPGTFSGVELTIKSGLLSLTFLSMNFEAAGWNFPDLYLSPDVSTLAEAEAAHTRIVAKEGFVRSRERGRRWWRRPTLYLSNATLNGLKTLEPDAARARLLGTLDALADQAGRPENPSQRRNGVILALDTAWADAEGDWNPACALFGDFDEYVAFRNELRERGHALLLTLAPFKIGAGSKLFEEAPWLVLKETTGLPATDKQGDYFYDHTHLEARPLMTDQVDFLLGTDEEQLDADGVILAPAAGPPNTRSAWNDPSRGAGERLWRRVVVALADHAHEIRPDALIELEAAEAFAQEAADRIAPLGLLGQRGKDATPRTLDSYGGPIPQVEGVQLVHSLDETPAKSQGKVYQGLVFSLESADTPTTNATE